MRYPSGSEAVTCVKCRLLTQ
ncbi:MAG: hypothetical protein LBH43_07070 [Treponema sp.]|nr:hypothetical protein [Treponema sp.]